MAGGGGEHVHGWRGSETRSWEASADGATFPRARVCVCILTQESELLRLMAFESYGALLAKVSRRVLVFPLRHQVFNLLILLVLHLEDVNVSVAQVRPEVQPQLRWGGGGG